jgi:FSR family fosmidomycin resistance protein-like MFS transporter
MSLLSRPAFAAMNTADLRLIGSVSFAHFVSHINMIILPPLFAIVREDFNVSYTELGLALVVFNAISGVLQVPVGFLVDRIGARKVLIAGLVMEGVAFTATGLLPSFPVFVAMHALAGLGNTVFHPADYAYLSKRVSPRHVGIAFSFHSFAGMAGMAVGPAATLALYALFGWRGAFIGMMALTWLSAAILMFEPDDRDGRQTGERPHSAAAAGGSPPGGMALLMSPAIMLNFMFFVFLAFVSYGLTNYLVVALQALHGTPFGVANTALSAFLVMTAVGVMVAGFYVDRIRRHGLLAAAGMTILSAGAVVMGVVDLGAVALVAMAGLIGFASGATYPSRDMLVRNVTPPGQFGKVFGFVTSGFNVAGVVAPFVYGPLLDSHNPRAVFLAIGAGGLLTVLTVAWTRKRSWTRKR